MNLRTWIPVMLAVAALPVLADDRYDRDRWGRDRGGYGPWSGSGSYGFSVVDQTMSDLRRVASRNRVDGHERSHFEHAMSDLDRFRYRWSRDRHFDDGRLNSAIGHIADLSRAYQIHPRDREILARDLGALRDFRSRRGGYGSRW